MTDLEKCKELLRSLIFLMDNERGDSDAADEIRDELDVYWKNLSTEEQLELRKLSIAAQHD